MLLFIIFLVGLLAGDLTWAFKVAGIYLLALIFVEALFWCMWLGLFGVILAILL